MLEVLYVGLLILGGGVAALVGLAYQRQNAKIKQMERKINGVVDQRAEPEPKEAPIVIRRLPVQVRRTSFMQKLFPFVERMLKCGACGQTFAESSHCPNCYSTLIFDPKTPIKTVKIKA